VPQLRVRSLLDALEVEQDRWFLWVPVLFGLGIAAYFALPFEPSWSLTVLPAALGLLLSTVWRSGGTALLVTSSLAAITFGFAAAKARTWVVSAPVLERAIDRVAVVGWIELVEPRPARGQRITVRVASMDKLPEERWPRRVRVRTLEASSTLKPGDAVRLVANLAPPAGPALPDGFDFARFAYFHGLGAVGYAREPPSPTMIARPPDRDLAWRASIERLRQEIGARITAVVPGETGAIANALITGERGGISDRTNDAYRDSGLFHILSISGLHMVIMAGSVFFAVRLLLTLNPALALRFEIKKWAATAAALGAFGYLLISGISFPTVRSYVMISIMYLAVLLDRPALALRNVALAAIATLAIWPESVVDPGFQMSFAAAVALISGFEALRNRKHDREPGRRGPLTAVALLLGGIVLSTLIASIAVAPIAAYHFQKSQQYAILANLIAIPICNVLVMPAALAALVAMPLGLETWPLKAMGLGIDAMTWCAYAVAGLPGAVMRIPAFSTWTVLLLIAGGLWLAIWQRRWRLLGIAPALVGLAIAPVRDAPDVLIARGGSLVAIRGPTGSLEAIAESSSRFELARWLDHDGDNRRPDDALSPRAFRCDWTGCVARVRGEVVAVSRKPASLADDCRTASVLIAVGQKAPACADRGTPPAPDASPPAPDAVIDPSRPSSARPAGPKDNVLADGRAISRRQPRNRPYELSEPDLSRDGAHALYLRPGGRIDHRSVAGTRGVRPWSAGPQAHAQAGAQTLSAAKPSPAQQTAAGSEQPRQAPASDDAER
jgi:competence protein ComEC